MHNLFIWIQLHTCRLFVSHTLSGPAPQTPGAAGSGASHSQEDPTTCWLWALKSLSLAGSGRLSRSSQNPGTPRGTKGSTLLLFGPKCAYPLKAGDKEIHVGVCRFYRVRRNTCSSRGSSLARGKAIPATSEASSRPRNANIPIHNHSTPNKPPLQAQLRRLRPPTTLGYRSQSIDETFPT